jgi:hypothetical protein
MPTSTADVIPAASPDYSSSKATHKEKWLLLAGAVVFERLFWQQRLGINGLVFVWLAVGVQLLRRPRPTGGKPLWVATGGALLSGVLMAVYGSFVARLAGWVSLALVLAFARLPELRSVGYALLSSWANWLQAGPALVRLLRPARWPRIGAWRGWFYGRLLGVPLVALFVFHSLFALANPRYARLTAWLLRLLEQLLDAVLRGLEWLFEAISIAHLVVWVFAVTVAGAVVLRATVRHYAQREARCQELLERRREPRRRPFRLPDLRRQYVMVLVLLGLLNGLLLLVNAIDVNWLWLGQRPATAIEMKQFVHEGTYALLFSILLAMSIVLWAFRGNLNFYAPGLPWLRWSATAWVAQNAVLAFSVGLRNYYYIVATGLAYKRIGVCAFLLLTVFGLFTIGLKVWQRRTAYSLVRLNGWAVYAMLLMLAAGNWEVWMARYNLQRQRLHIDLSFLLELPGRTLPALHARRAVLAAPQCTPLLMRRRWAEYSDVDVAPGFALDRLATRTRAWGADYRAHHSWQSWNYANWRAYQTLTSTPAQP